MASTPLLGLSLPADGTTNWGTLVNTSITALLDSAVAGTTTLSSDADVTLSATTEATNQARQAIILWNATGTVTRNITAPAQSKTYVVINATGGTQSIIFRGSGSPPTTGVTIPAGAVYLLAWNGSDFVTLSSTSIFATDITVNGITVGRGAGNNGSSTTVGNNALDSNISGVANTAIGYESLRFTTAGSYNTMLGHSAGRNLLGDYNTAIGYGALQGGVVATGNNNIAIGVSALANVTTASNNIAIGSDALYSTTTTSQFNIAIGANALSSALSDNNIGIGNDSVKNTSGSQNIGIGNSSLTLINGLNNISIGYLSMYGGAALGSNTATDNTAIGYSALSGITTGDLNTVVGKNAGSLINTGSKNTIIGSFDGNQGGLDIRSSSNYIVLSDGDGNPRAYWNAANATFGGNLAVNGSITSNTVPVVTTTGTQTLSNKTLDISCTYNGTATGIAGGSAGQIPYQTGTGTTGFVPVGTNGYLLQSLGSSAPNWVQKTSANTANTVVNRDASGGFAVNQLEITTGYGITWDSGGASDPYQKYVSRTILGNNASVMEFGSPGLQYLTVVAGVGGPAGLWLDPSTGGTGQIGTIGSYNLNLYRDEVLYQTLDANGTVLASGKNLGLGGTSPSTSGAGITFPATQSASSDVNTLDDYEEGTFTPAVTGSTTSGTVSYGVSQGYYTKVGRLVTFSVYLGWYNGFGGAGDLRVSLPFTCNNGIFFISGTTAFGAASPATQYPVSQAGIAAGNSYMTISVTSGINTQMSSQAWAAFGSVNMTGFYYT